MRNIVKTLVMALAIAGVTAGVAQAAGCVSSAPHSTPTPALSSIRSWMKPEGCWENDLLRERAIMAPRFAERARETNLCAEFRPEFGIQIGLHRLPQLAWRIGKTAKN